MTINESRLLCLVRESNTPDEMLAYAIDVILSVLQQPQSSEVSSPADEGTPGGTIPA